MHTGILPAYCHMCSFHFYQLQETASATAVVTQHKTTCESFSRWLPAWVNVAGQSCLFSCCKLHLQNIRCFQHLESTWLLRKDILEEEINMSNGNTWTHRHMWLLYDYFSASSALGNDPNYYYYYYYYLLAQKNSDIMSQLPNKYMGILPHPLNI